MFILSVGSVYTPLRAVDKGLARESAFIVANIFTRVETSINFLYSNVCVFPFELSLTYCARSVPMIPLVCARLPVNAAGLCRGRQRKSFKLDKIVTLKARRSDTIFRVEDRSSEGLCSKVERKQTV